MKKFIFYITSLVVIISIVACNFKPAGEDLVEEIGDSDRFREEDIINAIETVKENFDFPGASLRSIGYDEDQSDEFIEGYLEDDLKNEDILDNIIVLSTSFYVDDSGDNPVLNPGSTYDDYKWILVREFRSSQWEIKDFGY